MACRVTPDSTGQQADGVLEVKEFGTLTRDLLALSDWLAAAGITQVAMESTGEYWRPVYNLLGGTVTIFLVNAAPVTQVPGRKTRPMPAGWRNSCATACWLPASSRPRASATSET